MRLQRLVDECYGAFDAEAAMADVKALCEFDRYQASAGLQAAAEYVAERAPLSDVEVLQYPADGMQRWWTFRGPPSWTPLKASLRVGETQVVSYPEQPYALAAYSAACAGKTVRVVSDGDVMGALVLTPTQSPAELARRGAFGFVSLAGRVELPPESPLVAFCVNEEQLAVLRNATTATVSVELGEPVSMPVVTGVLPGNGPELLLTAHLCHPRPSANDNASGVAALLAVAAVLRKTEGAPVRFVWGPEFVGTAAFLQRASPAVGINVDMAGEDQALCGGPLVIERSPDERPSYVTALAERVAALMPGTRSYSGAVPCDVWGWRSVPHVGASDHALFPCPSVGLGHWPDRFNHTRFDTFDKVSAEELRRTATLAASVIGAIRIDDAQLHADVADATLAWAAAYMAGGMGGAAPRRQLEWDEPVYDPWCASAAARRTAHRRAVAQATVASLSCSAPSSVRSGKGGMKAYWDGPINLRALAEDCSQNDRAWLDACVKADRGGAYARMSALARGIDGRRSRYSVGWWAALASELTIPVAFAERFLDVLCAAGWAGEA